MVKRIVGATDQDLEQLTSLFRLLSDKTRLNIFFCSVKVNETSPLVRAAQAPPANRISSSWLASHEQRHQQSAQW